MGRIPWNKARGTSGVKNFLLLEDGSRAIKMWLKQDKYTIIDEEFFERVNEFKWSYNLRGYAQRMIGSSGKSMLLHRFIIDAPSDKEVDHINGNRLDNRKANLRLSTRIQNCWNSKWKNKTGFKGVSIAKHGYNKKYIAAITCRGKVYRLGYFSTAREAGKAYDKKAHELFGEFAKTNLDYFAGDEISGKL